MAISDKYKGSKLEAGKRSISEIFNGSRVLEIPFFQRSYVWSEKEWARLLEDMEGISKYNKQYFLGSVILKQQETSTSSSSGDVRTLIDGQQRLTTLNIFFKVLCLLNNKNSLFENRFKLHRDGKISLRHNHNDLDSFNTVIDLEELIHLDNDESTFCHIKGAYNYFKNKIDINTLDFFNIIENIMFVGIDLNRDEDEQQIFDTINSLGVRLTTAELLKNYLFDREDLDSYEKNWKSIFELDKEAKLFWDREVTAGRTKRENIDLFFYSFLQIKLQDKKIGVKADDKKRLSKFSGLFESYKEFMSLYCLDKELLIQEIKQYAEIYRDNIDFNVIDRELTAECGIERVNALIFGLDYTVIIPFVLYVLKATEKEEQNNIFKYLESYLLRRMISKSTNKSYSNLFSEELIFNEINTMQKFQVLIEEKTDKNNAMPSDDDVKNGFLNSKLINKQTAGILYLIESKIRDKSKQSTALLGLNRYSLEHLMPKKWENKWDSVNTQEEKHNRNSKLLTLGNLAIITSSLNTSIRDSSWQIKKEGSKGKKGLKEFASGIETINKYLDYEHWDEVAIEQRAEYLFENAVKIWSL